MEPTGLESEVRSTNTAAGQRFLRHCGTSNQSSSLELIGLFSEGANLSGRDSLSVYSLGQTLQSAASETVSNAARQTAEGDVDSEV